SGIMMSDDHRIAPLRGGQRASQIRTRHWRCPRNGGRRWRGDAQVGATGKNKTRQHYRRPDFDFLYTSQSHFSSSVYPHFKKVEITRFSFATRFVTDTLLFGLLRALHISTVTLSSFATVNLGLLRSCLTGKKTMSLLLLGTKKKARRYPSSIRRFRSLSDIGVPNTLVFPACAGTADAGASGAD
ncbi:MAG: hypothetical protein AB3N11_09165, partial [Arenibacterium sp.]